MHCIIVHVPKTRLVPKPKSVFCCSKALCYIKQPTGMALHTQPQELHILLFSMLAKPPHAMSTSKVSWVQLGFGALVCSTHGVLMHKQSMLGLALVCFGQCGSV